MTVRPIHIQLGNVLLFAAVIVTNYLATALPINGRTTGAISDSYQNLFVPAGITFSIWGLIYLLLTVFIVLQFRASFQSSSLVNNFAFINSAVLNCYWIIAFHFDQLFLSLIIMITLVAVLTMINLRLDEEKNNLMKLVFGVYLGWLEIATIANMTALLVASDWGGFGIDEVTWTIVLIASGIVISSVTMIRLNNPYLAISIVWAFYGIVLKREQDQPDIVLAAEIAMAAVALAAIYTILKGRRGSSSIRSAA